MVKKSITSKSKKPVKSKELKEDIVVSEIAAVVDNTESKKKPRRVTKKKVDQEVCEPSTVIDDLKEYAELAKSELVQSAVESFVIKQDIQEIYQDSHLFLSRMRLFGRNATRVLIASVLVLGFNIFGYGIGIYDISSLSLVALTVFLSVIVARLAVLLDKFDNDVLEFSKALKLNKQE